MPIDLHYCFETICHTTKS